MHSAIVEGMICSQEVFVGVVTGLDMEGGGKRSLVDSLVWSQDEEIRIFFRVVEEGCIIMMHQTHAVLVVAVPGRHGLLNLKSPLLFKNTSTTTS